MSFSPMKTEMMSKNKVEHLNFPDFLDCSDIYVFFFLMEMLLGNIAYFLSVNRYLIMPYLNVF